MGSRDRHDEGLSESRARYPALRMIAGMLSFEAYCALFLTPVVGGFAGASNLRETAQWGAVAVGVLLGFLVGGTFWLLFKSWSELIYVQLDIEQNTRQHSHPA